AIEQSSGCGAVKAAVVEAEPYARHVWPVVPFRPALSGKIARTKPLTMRSGVSKVKQKCRPQNDREILSRRCPAKAKAARLYAARLILIGSCQDLKSTRLNSSH